jgi:hypothetical protein
LLSNGFNLCCYIEEVFRQFVPGRKKGLAFALTVVCVNILGTFAYMFGGFFLINALTGVPLELDSIKVGLGCTS